MTGFLEKTMTDLQVIRPILEYFIWGIILIVILLFCFGSILQTRKRDDYDEIDIDSIIGIVFWKFVSNNLFYS